VKKSLFILFLLLIIFLGSSVALFAQQTYQTIASIDVAVGNATTPEIYGPYVVELFKKSFSCPHKGVWGYVSNSTANCVYKTQPSLVHQAAVIFHDSAIYTGVLQCVGFARGIAAAARHDLEGRNAKDYLLWGTPTGWKRIYKTSFGAITNPLKPGDMALWNWGLWGHIAVVTEVKGNSHLPYAFTVAEGNGQCSGCVDIHTYSYANPFFMGWLTK